VRQEKPWSSGWTCNRFLPRRAFFHGKEIIMGVFADDRFAKN
jgi:hypothetical protein